ncbi:HD domain-containing protein [Selenomonas sp. oral taxon 138]|uniref:HD domain-containing protein n=1 Tax=Selenomonas sp. oral taxon 138 TaxID=712532 RepID=UPI0012ED7051|nr:HD domain-containing protein [Selenomonas sp. oral taxon 138]
MTASKSNLTPGSAEKGSRLWMQRLVDAPRFPLLAQECTAQIGEEVEWIAPLPKNNFKEYKLNQNEAMSSLFPGADKMNIFDFWPKNQPQWDGIAIGRNSGTLYLVEAKSYRQEAEGQKSKAKDPKSINQINETLKKNHAVHFPQGNFTLWTEGHYQLANRLTFLYEIQARCVPQFFPSVRLILLNFVGDPTMKKTTREEWESYYSNVFEEMLGTAQTPQGVLLLHLDVELCHRYQALKNMVRNRSTAFAALMHFIEQETAYLTAPASTKYHLCRRHGPLEHSVNVAETMLKMRASVAPDLSEESCVIVALLHDLGKAGVPGTPQYLKNDEEGARYPYRWNRELTYLSVPVRSIYLILPHFPLTEEETQAIVYHDGQYVEENKCVAAREEPLTLLLQYADNWSGFVIEKKLQK